MTEPLYNYIRGTGWVPMFERKMLAFDRHGKSAWIIDRFPNVGELGIHYGSDEDDWYAHGVLDFEAPISFFKHDCTFDELDPFTQEQVDALTDKNRACTIILVPE